MQNQTCVVIGGGHAADQFAVSMRQMGWPGRLIVVTEEMYLPYHRPPLSKDMLTGLKNSGQIGLRQPGAYQKAGIEFMLGRRAVEIDRNARKLQLDNGEQLSYDKLALMLGARVRKLPIEGVDKRGVFYLRDLNDALRLQAAARQAHNAVIIGGGYIGLEAAASLRQMGLQVVVLEAQDRILQRVTAPQLSAFYERVHREEGVELVTGVEPHAIEGDEAVRSVSCADGRSYPADVVVIGVGIQPNTELAADAGLAVGDGIVVDENGLTSDPDIVSAGDCTYHYNALYDRHLRLESVQNATDQAKAAVAFLCGRNKPYRGLPWFWSDQYDVKLQIAGLSQGYDDVVVRGHVEHSRSFAAFYFKEGRLLAVDAVNRAPEFMMAKKLLIEPAAIDQLRLIDESCSLQDCHG